MWHYCHKGGLRMTKEQWENLEEGTKLKCDGKIYDTIYHDFYGYGEELCLVYKCFVFPNDEFCYEDIEIVGGAK